MSENNEHLVQQFDFANMPLTPAQETVALLKEIRDLLTPKAQLSMSQFLNKTALEDAKEAERKAKIDALQARVPVAKRK